MTPQLMQAIKLLQLSNLDLVAFVEEELERNPLLERAESDSSSEPSMDGAEASTHATEADGGGDYDAFDERAVDGAESASEDWLSRDLTTPSEMEQTFDSRLENVFSEEPADAAA